MAHSDVWLQIMADIAEVPVVRTNVLEGTCLAVAILAGVAVGVYADVAAATRSIQAAGQPGYSLNPRPEYAPIYRELYEEYLTLSQLTALKAGSG